ncbi:aspartyl/glutamyl-tRNA Asn/Gln amidotransferase subunit B, putative [Theileria equi strain WA]|uniref:Aspartyl/glutamyl-tRNA Asn/Gln amidotransferase subunit B, putative n=1 Tax=Theileria equi strain WA TaxID=1537102 RepID=L0B006_THEEQ|nr:aspartyl/glutamyl-tRNA Asn/Gln amidotransferase subunit B, putative [Theileria equi strain WA]AFZ80586.1 aspartyl/glutamyl-tRNA Asn/Gln amidotransferase subunit B, putative [Theileria equi strain WA]|eukprot:XP_004830252.1 aspartyl/glutamyl-tRNA Asn/Gln amidotransferase subunit B, putative [Theileria equi strain WA]
MNRRSRKNTRWFGLGVDSSSDSDSSIGDDFENRVIRRKIGEPKTYIAGIEAHIQLACESKIFCACKSTANAIRSFSDPNHLDAYHTDSLKRCKDLFKNVHDILETVTNYIPEEIAYKPFLDHTRPINLKEYIMMYNKSMGTRKIQSVDLEENKKMYLEENKYKCPTCTGEVGSTPHLSPVAILYGIAACKLFDCRISNTLSFDRKSYDYFDLPKGYQVTQTRNPLGTNGSLKLGNGKTIKIRQVHLEEDTAKISENDDTLDYNRSGIGLVEVVTEAVEMAEAEILETCAKIYDIAVKGGLSNGIMHQGNVRFDINLSLGSSQTRVEIKNLNSFSRARRAIRYFQLNDIEKCENNSKNKTEDTKTLELLKTLLNKLQEDPQLHPKENPACGMTLEWNQKEKKLEASRNKYGKESYINCPDPNIPVLYIEDDLIDRIEVSICDNHTNVINENMEKYSNVPIQFLNVINKHYTWVEYFDKFASIMEDPKIAAKFFVNILLPAINSSPEIAISPHKFADLLNCVADNVLNIDTVKRILPDIITNWNGSIMEYVEKHDLRLMGTEETIAIVEKYLQERSIDAESLR